MVFVVGNYLPLPVEHRFVVFQRCTGRRFEKLRWVQNGDAHDGRCNERVGQHQTFAIDRLRILLPAKQISRNGNCPEQSLPHRADDRYISSPTTQGTLASKGREIEKDQYVNV